MNTALRFFASQDCTTRRCTWIFRGSEKESEKPPSCPLRNKHAVSMDRFPEILTSETISLACLTRSLKNRHLMTWELLNFKWVCWLKSKRIMHVYILREMIILLTRLSVFFTTRVFFSASYRNSTAFKSFEEKVGGAVSNVKVKPLFDWNIRILQRWKLPCECIKTGTEFLFNSRKLYIFTLSKVLTQSLLCWNFDANVNISKILTFVIQNQT